MLTLEYRCTYYNVVQRFNVLNVSKQVKFELINVRSLVDAVMYNNHGVIFFNRQSKRSVRLNTDNSTKYYNRCTIVVDLDMCDQALDVQIKCSNNQFLLSSVSVSYIDCV